MTSTWESPFPVPPPVNRLNEFRAGLEAVRLAARAPLLRRTPTGSGRITLLLPGYGTSDVAMAPLRTFLSGRGHDAKGWGLGVNDGAMLRLLGEVDRLVRREFVAGGRPVNLVGWSLGGVLAREMARENPAMIHRVATFGTPLFGPRHLSRSNPYTDEELVAMERLIVDRQARPIEVPLTTIYSRNDGIVHWSMCIDETSPNNRNVEVASSHIGMGIDPDVWATIAGFLAED
ncbi:MAG: alpha/beta hydrolase [Acidimicrobiales bacterium]